MHGDCDSISNGISTQYLLYSYQSMKCWISVYSILQHKPFKICIISVTSVSQRIISQIF